ncbi:MAG: SRPBCC domain-containing protein [Actinophytocola sp.]|uniref:SRPBCC domain-containing protein n=1 Tax=Actinophytocola sp. TaxID=1872138 RepID=UPI003D6C28AB
MTETIRLRARVDAPLETVHGALTDARALRVWLAEHAEVDLPHRFEFWGRYTPDGAEPRQRVLHADDRTLRLEWTVGGEVTTTEITLRPENERAAATVVELTQSHVPEYEAAVREEGLAALMTFWSLALAGLVDYLEGREPAPKCDFTTSEMRAQVDIAASPEAIYESLLDPEVFARWFGARVEVEPHVGGRWAMGGFDGGDIAKLVELEPARKVTMAWPELVTAWELEGAAGRTRLTIVQSGFEGEPPYASWSGWLSGLAELRRYHEVPNWRTIWLDVDMPGMPDDILTIG